MYSNEKHRENGIFDIILSVVFCIMIFCAPFVDVVVNGQIAETKTLAGFLKEHSDNAVSLILIIFPVLTLVIGILKFSFSRLFYHYVLVVLDLYNGLFALAMGIGLFWAASTVAGQAPVDMIFYSVKYQMGFGPLILPCLGIGFFVYTLSTFCGYYKWYPLQTLFWGVYLPLIRPAIVSSLYVVIAAIISGVGTSEKSTIVVSIIISILIFVFEFWLLYTYRKEWNRKLRSRTNRGQQEAVLTATATDGGPEGGTEVLPPSEMIPATVAVPVSEEKRKTEIPVRRKTSFYYIIGLVVLVAVIAFIYIIRKGEDRAVNIPAIKEMTLSGQVAGKEVQMALTQIGDSLYGSYSYKHINNPIQLTGKKIGVDYIIDETVNGKKTGTFKLFDGEYNGDSFFTGDWSNGKRKFNVQLNYTNYKILPSTDADHPFVGEWKYEKEDGTQVNCSLSLYNRDIDDDYGKITSWVNDDWHEYKIDSILSLEGRKAVVQAKYDNRQKITLVYDSSNRSLSVDIDQQGTYVLSLNQEENNLR